MNATTKEISLEEIQKRYSNWVTVQSAETVLFLEKNSTRPEHMRVLKIEITDGHITQIWYSVESKRDENPHWVAMKEYKTDKEAVLDCVNWY